MHRETKYNNKMVTASFFFLQTIRICTAPHLRGAIFSNLNFDQDKSS